MSNSSEIGRPDVPAPQPGSVTRDESSQISLPTVFDRGPGFESLTASAERGAALGYPFLTVVNDIAGMALSPVSVLVSWSESYGRARVSVQFADPDDVDTVAEFYDLADDTSSGSIYQLAGHVPEEHHGTEAFDLSVFGPSRGDR